MNKEDLKIVIVDDSEFSCVVIQKMLNTAGFHNVSFYTHPVDFIEYYKKTEDVIDIIFIDYSMPDINGMNVLSYIKYKDKDIITVMVTGILDINLKQKAIELGVNEFMQKSIDYPEFKTKIDVLANLKLFQYREAQKNDELNTILKYKDAQENLAVQKQLKIINDELSFHYYNNIFIGSYFKPKDILSGDSYSAIKVDDDRLLFVISDGMGKGVSASLSSVLTVSFITYATKRSMEFDDFNFDRLIKDMFGYVKSIMLADEAMSMVLIEYNTRTKNLKYANFGIPPIYLRTANNEIEKIKPNNRPILMGSKDYNIDEKVVDFKTFLVATDGLMESLMRDDRPYFTAFKNSFKKADSLREIIDDFYKDVEEPDDDMTVFFMKVDDCDYETIVNEDILLEPKYLEEYLEKINISLNDFSLEQKVIDKVVFVLNELLLNAYEHTVVKISENKHKIIKNNEKIEYNGEEKFARLKVIKNSICVVIEIDDNGEGFDVNEVIKQELFNKYHGRGLKMINKLTNGIFYNQKGNNLKVYLKREQSK
jgi:serine phosphatase RsbU (regulator of sigma subunit)